MSNTNKTLVNAETITDDEIEQLLTEASEVGDTDQIRLCRQALDQLDNEHGEEISVSPRVREQARVRCARIVMRRAAAK